MDEILDEVGAVAALVVEGRVAAVVRVGVAIEFTVLVASFFEMESRAVDEPLVIGRAEVQAVLGPQGGAYSMIPVSLTRASPFSFTRARCPFVPSP
ncbi:hypothetical protein [Schaalia hyovaginalis]|uniref:hypothetical protein n=1 Tax=Schaalia hyovaginalis TaxID=29316 RepID=UPI0012B400AB|nr:hypothetical protein [Schaalia hyovaginalis]MST64362.1 hypothetical protein [Schaalia hyovaginalis]